MTESNPPTADPVERSSRVGGTSAGARQSMQRSALAYVCVHRDRVAAELVSLSVETGDNSLSGLVDGLLDAVTGDGGYGPWLDRIDAALRAPGNALGLYGLVGADRGPAPGRLVGGSSAMPPPADETVYLCPMGYCSRHAFVDDSGIPH